MVVTVETAHRGHGYSFLGRAAQYLRRQHDFRAGKENQADRLRCAL